MTTHLNPTFIDGAVLHVPSIFIVSRNKKKYQDFSDEISNFTAEKKKKKKMYVAWASFRNDITI